MNWRVLSVAFGAALLIGSSAGADRAHAGVCSATSCTLNFTQGNTNSGIGSSQPNDPFGSVTLSLDSTQANTVDVSISLQSSFGLINTGFPNGSITSYAVGFSDTLGIVLSFSAIAPSTYSGGVSDTTQKLKFDGFGYVNNAVASTSLGNTQGSSTLSFDVTGAGLTDVRDLVKASSGGGDGYPAFIIDVYDTTLNTTGLLGAFYSSSPVVTSASPVPEPETMTLFGLGLISLGLVRLWRRQS